MELSLPPSVSKIRTILFGLLPAFIRSKLGGYVFKRRIAALLKKDAEIKLVIGAFNIHDEGWVPTEIDFLDLLDCEHWKTNLGSRQVDAFLAEHVWEHLSPENGILAARQCFEYLKPGGYIRVAVPDGFNPNETYLNWVKPGGTGPGAGDHKLVYDYKTLSSTFKKAGFKISLLEYHDGKGVFNFVDWDVTMGKIHRSRRYDQRNRDGVINYTSLIIDAWKP